MKQSGTGRARTIARKRPKLRQTASEIEARRTQNLVRSKLGVNPVLARSRRLSREDDVAAAADAVTERAQAIGRCWPVPGKPAALATGRRFTSLVQRAAKVPSRCSSAFEILCPLGSDELGVLPGTCAYG